MIAALVAAFLFPAPASHNPNCLSREQMASFLESKYGEVPIWHGVDTAGRLVEIWASRDGQSWTLTVQSAGGEVCGVGSGMGWEPVRPQAPTKETKS